MKTPSKDLFKKIDEFFSEPPSVNQKAWGLIHEFYNLVLNHMEKNEISKAQLAQKLGKSRSAISQMFNKTPNISVKKMVEIAEAVNLNIMIVGSQTLQQEQIMLPAVVIKQELLGANSL